MKYNTLWHQFDTFRLTQNMRVGDGEREWANWLEQLGRRDLQIADTVYTRVPPQCVMKNEKAMIGWIYPKEVMTNPEELGTKIILSVRNEDVGSFNQEIRMSLERFGARMELIIAVLKTTTWYSILQNR